MMKLSKKIFVYLLTLSFIITSLSTFNSVDSYAAANSQDTKRAVWISFLDFETYLQNKNESDFKKSFEAMCDKALDNNLNTVIVQCRAYCDAIYPSNYYPWASYINSSCVNPGFDPLKDMIEIAHKKNLKFEAWVNPYRVSTSSKKTEAVKATSFYSNHVNDIIEYNYNGQNCLILNPASNSAIKLITDGVKEIVSNYDVDGIHMDDYFYMEGMWDSTLVSDRKANVNKMVRSVYSSIKSIKPFCEFGISPAGNIDNARNAGADVDTWLSQFGYIDYLMPQIYWSDNYLSGGNEVKMYSNRASAWMSLKKNSVKMYVGLALYKAGLASSSDLGWTGSDRNLANQYSISKDLGYEGYALFRYEFLFNSAGVTEAANLKNTVTGSVLEKADGIEYKTHVQTFSWTASKFNGEISGTSGLAKRLECIAIKLNGIDGGVTYRTHVQTYGWMDWKKDGEMSGTTGEAKRIEAIEILLTGNAKNIYDVYYRLHIQSYGWLGWAKNGEPAGSSGYAKRAEAIQIVLVKKGTSFAAEGEAYVCKKSNVTYSTHMQSFGWLGTTNENESAGLPGTNYRLEAFKINISNSDIKCDVKYASKLKDTGWQNYTTNGGISGTVGQRKEIYAIKMQLTGTDSNSYSIVYRTCNDKGKWSSWVKDGQETEDSGCKITAIQIYIVKK